ncbi:SixA phosphatase family protein [Pseudobacteriovorax antillogorgiicola]|uniref:Phosphohistidine phosphatase n=1 Tax=Pseudobacteriovorax antillogorgiicola TaxID=1513793 RepID=A0A1Y6BGZ7_9BACT|nr:histidine phosphatase family protein [Pseudobacteriovorax antillogorgiicola]TCS57443.1 phosphohistidine phosphatase [Pseudobacteriovorax antillogorgiicola]SMF01019.1 phosphohistidine phosphatase [Pseudobacteriovorax antillogorgiicola]
MKRVQLLRHAKSSWDDPHLEDWQRPLNPRGKKSCQLMAPALIKAECDFQNIFVSSAKRAKSTIKRIEKALEKKIAWQVDRELYTFDGEDLLCWLMKCDDTMKSVLVVGHNPALEELLLWLTGGEREMPTCAFVSLDIKVEKWGDLKPGVAQESVYLYPKGLPTWNQDAHPRSDG